MRGIELDKRRIVWPIALMIAISVVSAIPGTAPDDAGAGRLLLWVPPSVQNVVHVPVYGFLAWLWCRALDRSSRRAMSAVVVACSITVAFGVLDEWHQTLVPGRLGALVDVALNVAGAVLGAIVYARTAVRAR